MSEDNSLNTYLSNVLKQLSALITSSTYSVLLWQDDLCLAAYQGNLQSEAVLDIFKDPTIKKPLYEHLLRGSDYVLTNGGVDTQMVDTVKELRTSIEEQNSSQPYTWLCIPIQFNKHTLGYLALVRSNHEPFSEDDIRIGRASTEIIALPIEKEFQYVEANNRAMEGRALFRVHQALTSSLELEPVLQLIADEARRLTNTRKSILFLIHGEYLRVVALSGEHSSFVRLGYDIPLNDSITGLSIIKNRPVRVENAWDNPKVYRNEHLQVSSFISVPLISGFKAIGAIQVSDKISGNLGDNDERIAWMLASSAVIAVENARHYQQEQERRLEADHRRQVAESLREILAFLNSHCPLPDTLHYIVQQACQLLCSEAGAIVQLQSSEQVLKIQAGYGLADQLLTATYNICRTNDRENSIFKKPCVFINPSALDNDADIVKNEAPCLEQLLFPNGEFFATITVPLVVVGKVYGAMLLYYQVKRCFSDDEIKVAVTVGDQTALAIENTALHQQAEDLARLQERQRIAQALHDSVAQMLFSLGIEVEKMINNPAVGSSLRQPLQNIRRMTARSSHELRSAIFALREGKGNGQKSGVVELVEELVAEFKVQSGIGVTCVVPTKMPDLQPSVTEAIYRIVRESLSNISKHSNASSVIVSLTLDQRNIHVMIQDDGIGLTRSQDGDERHLHFGVATMVQLAHNAHGEFRIMNGDDLGVLIKASFPITEPVDK